MQNITAAIASTHEISSDVLNLVHKFFVDEPIGLWVARNTRVTLASGCTYNSTLDIPLKDANLIDFVFIILARLNRLFLDETRNEDGILVPIREDILAYNRTCVLVYSKLFVKALSNFLDANALINKLVDARVEDDMANADEHAFLQAVETPCEYAFSKNKKMNKRYAPDLDIALGDYTIPQLFEHLKALVSSVLTDLFGKNYSKDDTVPDCFRTLCELSRALNAVKDYAAFNETVVQKAVIQRNIARQRYRKNNPRQRQYDNAERKTVRDEQTVEVKATTSVTIDPRYCKTYAWGKPGANQSTNTPVGENFDDGDGDKNTDRVIYNVNAGVGVYTDVVSTTPNTSTTFTEQIAENAENTVNTENKDESGDWVEAKPRQRRSESAIKKVEEKKEKKNARMRTRRR